MASKHHRTYEDFEPPVERSEEDGCTILTLYIPGFRKEEIKVQVSSRRLLRISGERHLKNSKHAWQRFHKEFDIPSNCDAANISAKYKGGILHVRQPSRDHQQYAKNANQQQQQQQTDQKKPILEQTNNVTNSSPNSNDNTHTTTTTANINNNNNNKFTIPTPARLKLVLPVLVAAAALLLFWYAKSTAAAAAMSVGVVQP